MKKNLSLLEDYGYCNKCNLIIEKRQSVPEDTDASTIYHCPHCTTILEEVYYNIGVCLHEFI